jgi:nucleotidyltransferase substrate binding protein (TIGR01987 family)
MTEPLRYQQRYKNYSKLIKQLNEYLSTHSIKDFSDLEQTGLATQFQLSFELMWKLLKDYLEYQEAEIGVISPKNVLRAAATSGLLEQIKADGEILIEAHTARNQLAHIYDYENAQDILLKVQQIYMPEMMKVEKYFDGK